MTAQAALNLDPTVTITVEKVPRRQAWVVVCSEHGQVGRQTTPEFGRMRAATHQDEHDSGVRE